MEIIIRDEKMPKNCYECSYLNYCFLKPDFKPTISKCPLKPLSQHDAEIRVEERKKVDIINYENSYSFFLWCETYNKSWFEVKRDTYTKCKDKMREFEDKFGDSIQLEILYLVKASY